MNFDEISKRLKREREDQDLTQDDLGELSGVSRSTISRVELGRGDEVKLRLYEDLAKALKVRIEWLLGFSHNKNGDAIPETMVLEILNDLEPRRQNEAVMHLIDMAANDERTDEELEETVTSMFKLFFTNPDGNYSGID